MFFNMNDDIEIARRAAIDAAFAFARNTEPRTSFDTGRDLYFEIAFLFDASLTVTVFARRSDDASLALTIWTGPHYAEKTLLVTCLPRAAARDAGLRLSSLFRAAAVAHVARF